VTAKKNPTACDGRALTAISKKHSDHIDFAFQSQPPIADMFYAAAAILEARS